MQPEIDITLINSDGDSINDSTLTRFPITIDCSAGPITQKPIAYYINIRSNGYYETTDILGNRTVVNEGQTVFYKFLDISDNTFSLPVQLYCHNCSKVILYISADVTYDETLEQYTIVGQQNVLTATSLEYVYDNDGKSSVLWLSSFNNYSKD